MTDSPGMDAPFPAGGRVSTGDGPGSAPTVPDTVARPPDKPPLEPSGFVGREREVGGVGRLLAGGDRLALCGPGGSGKARPALAVAQEVVETFADGAWWVELAPLADPDPVAGAVASALGLHEAPDRPPTEVLVEHLEHKRCCSFWITASTWWRRAPRWWMRC